MTSKKLTPLTPEQIEIFIKRLEQAMFFVHAAAACDDEYELELVNKFLKATAAISHVGNIMMRCAEDLGIPGATLSAVSRTAEHRVHERITRQKKLS